MSTTGLLLGFLMAGLSLLWLALPFIRHKVTGQEQSVQRSELLASYERIIAAVRDLDEDYQVGKISHEQYSIDREEWMDRGAAVLAALDKDQPRHNQPTVPTPQRDSDDPVEQAIAAYNRARKQASD